MSLLETLEQKARLHPKRVVFPECDNEMILKVAAEVVARKIGQPVLIGNSESISARAVELGISTEAFSFFNNSNEQQLEELADEYTARFDELSRKAVLRKAKDPVNCAMLLVKTGRADCAAAGREYTTAEVIVAAQNIIGMQESFSSISSLGIVNVPGFEGPEGQLLAIADCAVNAAPDADELADIAISSGHTVKTLLGWEPRIAMLSFSTCGSTEHESIDVIRKAIDIVHGRVPDLKIDGEFQLDAAISPGVAANKVKRESDVAGKANVLIFPNLHAGNIGVKLIQLFGQADAYGPVLQGFAQPICDFSRSAPLSEMMGNIIMLIVRAQHGKEL
jgi:phosphate acetyltransferase